MASGSKMMTVDEAVKRFVEPGMHLHFSSSPSRSNAAIRAVCRRFRGKSPRFTLSSTGFHSTAHLLAKLRLGVRYIACFYGDNYPTPRPNPLYGRLEREGAVLEHWSLLSYVTAFRAGALGHPYGVTTSILGSSLEPDLAHHGRFVSVRDPAAPEGRIGLVAAMRPDVTFIHVPIADAKGGVIAPLPGGEGMWAALAATQGVVVTAEQIVPEDVTARMAASIALPPHRILAVCEAPFGAHPQPLVVPSSVDVRDYADDFEAYEAYREVTVDDHAHAELLEVMLGDDETYLNHFELERRRPTLFSIPPPPNVPNTEPSPSERLVILAARRLVQVVKDRGYRVILAGVGHAFFAARMAKIQLEREGIHVDVLVETGMYGIDCGPASGSFLLGFNVVANARRLSSIEDVLGAVTCGAGNRCIGVIGAAQVDPHGNLNSTRLEDGSLLVGSGGANDIASTADEVIVLASADSKRLVRGVSYITSPGRGVRNVVTEDGVLCREANEALWRIEDAIPIPVPPPLEAAGDADRRLLEEALKHGSSHEPPLPQSSRLNPASSRMSPPSSRMSPPSSKLSPPSSKVGPASEVPISIEPSSDPLSWRELRTSRSVSHAPGDSANPGARLRRVCPWPISRKAATVAAPLTHEERGLLRSLDHARRSRRST